MIAIVIMSGGVFFFKKVTTLQLKNMDHPRMICIRISPSEQFSVSYTHSIYREPVGEEFQVEGGMMLLKGVRTGSPGVMEYYGFQEMRGFHPMSRRLAAIYLKWGTGEGQELTVRGKKIYLRQVGEKGDRILLKIETVALGRYLLRRVFNSL